MKLIEIKSDINNKVDLMIEHKKLNNSSHHLNYILTKINDTFYFVDARSELVTINGELICPYCLQKLTITRTYKKKNGTIVQFFVKHISKNKMSEGCIFKNKAIGDYNSKVEDFYKSKEFINRSLILMLKEEISNKFEILVPKDYEILKQKDISIKFKYKKHKIVGIYPSNTDEFICRLKTEKNDTLFCMLGDNEINVRNKYKEIWKKNDVTIITVNENKPYVNSEIEPKVNTHSKFYTSCLYSNIQQQAYDLYTIEHEKYKNDILNMKYNNTKTSTVEESNKEEVEKFKNRRVLEKAVDHELERVKIRLENKLGLLKVNENLWKSNDGSYYKLVNIKVTKNEIYFYRQCPEIYLRYIEKFGYKIEVV